MNKKVSTIFAMAALAGGVFCGSAYAADLDKYPVRNADLKALSGKVVLQQTISINGVNETVMLGYVKDANGQSQVSVKPVNESLKDSDVLNYAWNVTSFRNQENTGDLYNLINAATGDTLSFDANGDIRITGLPGTRGGNAVDKVYAKDSDGKYNFDIAKNGETYTGVRVKVSGIGSVDIDTDGDPLTPAVETPRVLTLSQSRASISPSGVSTTIQALAISSVPAKDLNALFNERGFNFAAKPALANVAVNGNIFAEQTVWAFEVNAGNIREEENKVKENGSATGDYYLTTTGNNQTDLIIPEGTYFFTNVVFKNGKTFGSSDLKAEDIDWLKSTLVYLSATESEEGTDSDRANGGGFLLQAQQGTEFKYNLNASDPQGNDTWITNASFTVQTNFAANDNYPYSLTVSEFWYQPKKNAAGTDKQKKQTVCMAVESYDNSRQSLVSTTFSGDPVAVFKLEASSVVDGKTLLHDTKKAAVYTIKFISGNGYLNSKYLTVGSKDGLDFQWEAKGAAIYNEDYPIFQYTITGVNSNNEITFTNRETGENFTAQLFPADGENRYYMAIKYINGIDAAHAAANKDFKVQPYTVESKTNTYAVTPTDSEGNPVGLQTFAANYVVELKSIDVDSYAGFLKEDEAVSRAIAFARDVNDTSNKMYAYVEDGQIVDDDFTNDLYASAQWQLKKVDETEISRVYVYNNTTTQSVDNVPEGDKVKAYVYTLQYVEDGELKNDYLAIENDVPVLGSKTYFVIKENVDGSVSLIKANRVKAGQYSNVFTNLEVASEATEKAVEVKLNAAEDGYEFDDQDDVYESTSDAREIKTYLEEQPVDISWPANEGHVTIESELGNYITMNEDRDAIVVNENEADTYYLYVTDKKAVVPSFYITKGVAAENGERMFMFNPKDSVDYYVADGTYDKKYQWAENTTKVIFKAAKINDTRDTLTIDVKGETKYIAKKANDDNKNIWGGINRFKWQIIEAADADGYYYIRQAGSGNVGNYLGAWNEKVTWSPDKAHAMLFTIESVAAPTANEGVSATEVKIIATDGAINVKNAAGKNVVVSTILGQIVANEVLTSDNATISVPAGIVIVSVDGEEAVKVNVK